MLLLQGHITYFDSLVNLGGIFVYSSYGDAVCEYDVLGIRNVLISVGVNSLKGHFGIEQLLTINVTLGN